MRRTSSEVAGTRRVRVTTTEIYGSNNKPRATTKRTIFGARLPVENSPTMSGHSILFLGAGEESAEYLAELETLPCCSMLTRSAGVRVPAYAPPVVDLVILELGAFVADAAQPLGELIHNLRDFPVIALTDKAHEHRGIAAVHAGADGYLLYDDVSVESQDAIFERAVLRHALTDRLAETDTTALSILKNLNDGIIVVDIEGNILDINPAGRSILGLPPRAQPDSGWEQTFCCIDSEGLSYRNAMDLPLVRARVGEKFENQLATYRAPEQPDTILSLNGHGLYDGNGQLIGGVVTFRDVTDQARRTRRLEERARYDELTGLPNRRLFQEFLHKALAHSRRAEENDEPIREHLLLTRYSPERVARGEMLSVEDVQEILSLELIGVIPESTAVLNASNAGVPVILDRDSNAGQAYGDVVARYLGEDLPHRFLTVEKKGLLGRLFGS